MSGFDLEFARTLRESLYKESFIVFTEGRGIDSDCMCIKDFADVKAFLANLDPEVETDVVVFHGIVAPAAALPAELPKGVDAFVVVESPTSRFEACLIEHGPAMADYILSSDDLADVITEVMKDDEMVHHPYSSMPRIEDVLVIYGQELQLRLTIFADEIDDNISLVAKTLAEEIKEMDSAPLTSFAAH